MKKSIFILLICAPAFLQWHQKTGKNEIVSSPIKTMVRHSSLNDIDVKTSTSHFMMQKINDETADKYIKKFGELARTMPNKGHLCPTAKGPLRWARFHKGTVHDHIPNLQESRFPNFTRFKGVRIYPCIDDKDSLNYILVYTKTTGASDDHEDDSDNSYLLNINISADRWCVLANSEKINLVTSHHMCEPNCPGDKPRYSSN